MKILIIRMWADELNIHSYNCQEIGLAKALIRKGNKCDIVLYTEGNPREEDYYFDNNKYKIHIYYLKAKKFLKNCFYEKKIYELIKEYDLIQSSEYDQIANIKLAKTLNKKLVIYHGPYKSKYTKGYSIKCLISDLIILFNPKYKKTIFISKSNLAKEFLNNKGYKNVYNVGVGLDADRFNKVMKNDEIEKLAENKKEDKYILYVGRIEKRRNILFLLSVFNSIQKEYNDVKLILVGKGEKKYVDKCNNYINKNKLQNKVLQFKSFSQNELPGLYKCSDIFVLPTRYEIFGMVLLEAMYYKVPVFTTYNGGSSTLIEDEKNGFIIEKMDIQKWKNKIINLLKNEEEHKTISEKEMNTVKNNYNWDSLASSFIGIYKKE